MGKRGYREWTPTEEARLLHWMVLHPDSEWSWDMRAKEYSKTIRPRTAESLRSKLRQLRKNIRRHRPVRRRQARIARGMTAKQARKEQHRTREAPPFATTRVPAHRTHTKFREGAGPEQVESGGQAVSTAEPSKSSPMNQVGKCPVRGRALVRSVQDLKTSSLAQQPVHGPSRTMDLVWQLVYQFAGRTRPRPSSHPRH
ncbi:hypothetical protein CBS147333_9069 [Penicillium roqueforti]|nr:hypothetical protein CBS147333_9069 [Penicillium roqueforti]KAI3196682.1 hypothetical protein CBS147311_7286 [Penicillium roqueforti]KAI3262399.1 hypothetical protein CBS147308_9200 [Penicillium roqueforti]KAI3281231.1 hypothetical protein DTO003C3_9038 [Penicillium roqueforti]